MSAEARDAWDDFCDQYGVTFAALVEVIGPWLLEAPDRTVHQLVQRAREVDARRKRPVRGRARDRTEEGGSDDDV